jgi:modulator of FtsH protease HflK
MYTDAMSQVYSNVTKVMVDSKAGSNLLYLPLDKIMQMTAQGGAAAPVSASPTSSAPAPTTPTASTTNNARSRERESR